MAGITENITSNKLCVLVSRSEIKDYFDFYFLCKNKSKNELMIIYKDAAFKDSIFNDPPTVGYQIEEGYKFVLNNKTIYPKILIDFDIHSFEEFYSSFINTVYNFKN